MKKQKIQLAVLLAVLVLLAAAIPGVKYWNEKRETKEANAAKEEQDSKVVIDAAYEDVIKLTYDYEGETYAFEKEEDTWYAAEDPSLTIKESSIKNILSGVTPLSSQQTIENVTDFSQYGLDQPQRTITFETASASHILYVGDHNTITGTYYVCMPSEATVYVVEQTVITRFNQTLEDVTEMSDSEEDEGSEGEDAAADADANDAGESQDEAAAGDFDESSVASSDESEETEDLNESSDGSEETEDPNESSEEAAEDSDVSLDETEGTEDSGENPEETAEMEDSGER